MILSEYRTLIRLYVPSAKVTRVNDNQLDTLINRGVNDVNEFALAYQGNKKIDVTAEEDTIDLTSEIDDYLTIDKPGVWWNSGSASSPNWIKLDPYTRESLDREFPLWRDDASNDPQRYIIESNKLITHPKADTTLSEGLWAYFIKTAVAMTSGEHYPFTGSLVEITAFRVLDDAIIDYVRWKLARPLGQEQLGVITERDYRANLADKTRQLKRRLDLTASDLNRMRGQTIGRH